MEETVTPHHLNVDELSRRLAARSATVSGASSLPPHGQPPHLPQPQQRVLPVPPPRQDRRRSAPYPTRPAPLPPLPPSSSSTVTPTATTSSSSVILTRGHGSKPLPGIPSVAVSSSSSIENSAYGEGERGEAEGGKAVPPARPPRTSHLRLPHQQRQARPQPPLPTVSLSLVNSSASVLERLEAQSQPTPEEKAQKKRGLVAKEIYTTEKTYVECLQQLIDNYRAPMEKSGLVEPQTLKQIFLNVDVLLALHKGFLASLEKCVLHSDSTTGSDGSSNESISQILLGIVPTLKVYTEYVNQYGNSAEALSRITAKKKVATMIEFLGTGMNVGILGLESLRHTPIQRIPRYVLLIKELMKYTPEDHEDHPMLKESYEKMSELANYINERKRRDESIHHLNDISQHLTGPRLGYLLESPSWGSTPVAHTWKKSHKTKRCNFCQKMSVGSVLKCSASGCKFHVHEECSHLVPHNCGLPKSKPTLIKYNRYLIEEARNFKHKMTSLSHPDSKAKVKDCLVLFFNDGLAVLHYEGDSTDDSNNNSNSTIAPAAKSPASSSSSLTDLPSVGYEFVSLIRWYSRTKQQAAIINDKVTDIAFSITDPRYDELHTFTLESAEAKDEWVERIRCQMKQWQSNASRSQALHEEKKEQLKDLTLKILFTVPVKPETEKEFTAYVVELNGEKGSFTIIKRYRQFLKLNDFLGEHYKNIPKFPGKRYLRDNTDPKFIMKRCQKLTRWLNEVWQLPGILELEEVRTFFTTTISAKGEKQDALIDRRVKENQFSIGRQRGSTIHQVISGELQKAKTLGPDDTTEAQQQQQTETSSQDHLHPEKEKQKEREGDEGPEYALDRQKSWEGPLSAIINPSPYSSTSHQSNYEEHKGFERAVALWDFVSENERELDMLAGDTVYIQERVDETWWFGTINGRNYGYFPSNYVKYLG
ncbi:Rho guanine nucleotide exchange factor (GEF) 17 [Balamuthia mandrillaris]